MSDPGRELGRIRSGLRGQTFSFDGLSQYSQGGKSSCGPAALSFCKVLLHKAARTQDPDRLLLDLITSPQVLQEALEICRTYSLPEHYEIDVIFAEDAAFNHFLSSSNEHQVLLENIEGSLRHLDSDQGHFSCVLTRPPEIIAVVKIICSFGPVFVLFDPHPRHGAGGAGITLNANIRFTAEFIQQTFYMDPTVLPDVPSYQRDLYRTCGMSYFTATGIQSTPHTPQSLRSHHSRLSSSTVGVSSYLPLSLSRATLSPHRIPCTPLSTPLPDPVQSTPIRSLRVLEGSPYISGNDDIEIAVEPASPPRPSRVTNLYGSPLPAPSLQLLWRTGEGEQTRSSRRSYPASPAAQSSLLPDDLDIPNIGTFFDDDQELQVVRAVELSLQEQRTGSQQNSPRSYIPLPLVSPDLYEIDPRPSERNPRARSRHTSRTSSARPSRHTSKSPVITSSEQDEDMAVQIMMNDLDFFNQNFGQNSHHRSNRSSTGLSRNSSISPPLNPETLASIGSSRTSPFVQAQNIEDDEEYAFQMLLEDFKYLPHSGHNMYSLSSSDSSFSLELSSPELSPSSSLSRRSSAGNNASPNSRRRR